MNYVIILVAISLSLTSVSGQTAKPQPAFDLATAKIVIEKQNRALESAIRKGDSIGAGNFYTIDAVLLPSLSGRAAIVKDVGEMVRDSAIDVHLELTNLSGDKNVLIEDATLSIYYSNGKLANAGTGLLVWKKINSEWRIFREIWKFEKK